MRETNFHIYLFKIQENSYNIQETTHWDTRYKWKPIREKTMNFWLKVMWRKLLPPHYIIFLQAPTYKRFIPQRKLQLRQIFYRLQPTRGSYLNKLQLEKGLQSLNYNTKTRVLVTLYKFIFSSLLHIFSTSLVQLYSSFVATHESSHTNCLTTKVLIPFKNVYFISMAYWLFVFSTGIWNETLSLILLKLFTICLFIFKCE